MFSHGIKSVAVGLVVEALWNKVVVLTTVVTMVAVKLWDNYYGISYGISCKLIELGNRNIGTRMHKQPALVHITSTIHDNPCYHGYMVYFGTEAIYTVSLLFPPLFSFWNKERGEETVRKLYTPLFVL